MVSLCATALRYAAIALSLGAVQAYIPAVPVNDTSLIVNSADLVTLAWVGGTVAAPISRQLVADPQDENGDFTNGTSTIIPWSKYAKGVVVHFSEAIANQSASLVPWIAFISCDSNGTTFSMQDDIFTLARDRGAKAALLYSLTSAGCLINEDYILNFEKPLDVYATRDIQNARVIENQFEYKVGSSAYNFSSQMLNDSADAVASLLDQNSLYIIGNFEAPAPSPIVEGTPTFNPSTTPSASPGPTQTAAPTQRMKVKRATSTSPSAVATATKVAYLGAVLAAQNLTVGAAANTTNGAGAGSTPVPSTNNNNGPNTGLAMIILYAITGVVTFMFLVVIMTGAIRAMRHPERYGPRRGATYNGTSRAPQTRAGGLTRAILDTFPVVKFGRSETESVDPDASVRTNDPEAASTAHKDIELEPVIPASTIPAETEDVAERMAASDEDRRRSASSSSFVSARSVPAPPPIISSTADSTLPLGDTASAIPDVNPADVDDTSTCPICVCEFETGEDVRILPCDGRHRFHRDCIDPWLLQVSSLCPLCRLDLSGGAGREEEQQRDEQREQDIGEQQVISNLRAMLQGHRGSVGAGGAAPVPGVGGQASRLNFFRYVARRRQQQVAARLDSTVAESQPLPPLSEEGRGSGRRRRSNMFT